MQDLVNGRTDVIVNDYYLQKMAVAAIKDKYLLRSTTASTVTLTQQALLSH